eukprot:scaffold574_cov333-Pavlova_lutheri.AAC.49
MDAFLRVRAAGPRLEAAVAAAELADPRPPGVGRSILAVGAWTMPTHVETFVDSIHVTEGHPTPIQRARLKSTPEDGGSPRQCGRSEAKRTGREGGWRERAAEEGCGTGEHALCGYGRGGYPCHPRGRSCSKRDASLARVRTTNEGADFGEIPHDTKSSPSRLPPPRRGTESEPALCR